MVGHNLKFDLQFLIRAGLPWPSGTMFDTVRLRTTAAKRFKRVENATALIWKLLQVAESTFRKLKGAELLPAVYAGAQYVDGVLKTERANQQMAA
jgi:hypothetical protein